MIKFFRKIRYDLMEKNKTGKYIKYAIGEIVLVVIGILIALSINNWNETRKLELKKQELVLNLIDDFQENITQLKPAIEYGNDLFEKMDAFFINAYDTDIKISVDSLKTLSEGFFRPTQFFPSMVTYDEAKANGNLTLLKNKDLSKEFVQFQLNYSNYLGIQNQAIDSYFKGSVWELKKSIGSLGKLVKRVKQRNYNQINNNSYLKLINTPLIIATFENQYDINANAYYALKQMDSISEKIVKILNELKK
jgi:type II secretory pathway pseudopilin PulG